MNLPDIRNVLHPKNAVRAWRLGPGNKIREPDYDNWTNSLVEFRDHVWDGTARFVILALPAVGLDIIVRLLSKIGTNGYIVFLLKLAEHTLITVDVAQFLIPLVCEALLFLTFTVWTTWRRFRKMFDSDLDCK